MNTHKLTNEMPGSAFDLSDLLVFLWQKKGRIIITTLILLVIGSSYIIKLTKYYTASSTLLLGSEKKGLSLPSSMARFAGSDDSEMNTYIEFMRSKQFAERVVLGLELDKSREFQPAVRFGTNLEQLQHSVRFFIKHLSLLPVADTELLKVSFISSSPQQASKIVNYIGPAFFIFYAEKGKKKADETSAWLNNQLILLEKKLDDADISLQVFMRENRLVDISSQAELARTEMSALLTEKLLNEKALAGIENVYQQVKSFDNNYASLMQNAYFLQNALVINLRGKIITQQQMIDKLSKRYKTKHHRYITANTALQGLNEELVILLDNLISNLEQQYNSLKVRRDSLVGQIAAIKTEYSELGKHELQLERLRREVESTQKLYELFLARLQETEILKDLGDTEDFVVVDFANDPRVPSKPKVKILISVLAVLCGFISVLFWLVVHLVADKKTRLKKLLQKQRVVVLGELPKPAKVRSAKYKNSVVKIKAPTRAEALYSDSVRLLRSEIMVRSDDVPIRTLLIASVQQGKRRSKLTIKLAESFGGLDKSILVDADLRNPQIGKEYGLEQRTPGLTNFISRRSTFSESSFREKDSQISVMPSGGIPNDPLVYLTKPRLGEFIKKLGVLFDRVIIETPPVNIHNDTLVISKLVDAVVLLCDLEVTESADLLEAIQRFQDAGAPLLGVVFENVKNIKSKSPQPTRGKI